MKKKILIIYYSNSGSTEKMAEKISRGVNSVDGAEAVLRTLPKIENLNNNDIANNNSVLYATKEDLNNCNALILGSPTHFGNMAAPMKYFLDGTTSEWFNNSLCGKPAGVFTSTSSIHGGQESTLLSMMLPLMHHGMVVAGVPYSENALAQTRSGGTPYGSSHLESDTLSPQEINICRTQGKRMATLALKLL